jgi:amino acid adenylation domain-containing protein
VDYPDLCAHDLFERQVALTPDAVAVVFKEQRLTYRELNQRANQVAHHLRARGIAPESLVGVSLERSPELVIGLLGVWKAGGAYVPLDPAYPPERLAFMVDDSGIRLLLTEERCRHLFPSAADMTICLDSDWETVAREANENPSAGASPSNLAYVMYTSGSTGRPKGAMILHRGLVNYLCWAIEAYGVEAGGSVPVHTSVSFDLTVTSLYPALLAGGQAELLPEDVGARNLLAALRRAGNRNLVKITPAHLDLLGQEISPHDAAGLTKAFVIGGENLVAESLQLWRDSSPGTRLINEYGPTETVVGCCVYEVQAGDPRSGSVPIGRPIANTQLYVLDPDLEPVPPGVMGELYIGGAGVARGYLNRPDLTRERFLVDPFSQRDGAQIYRTGDLARYRADGILEYLGRVDDQVKIRGYRIELGEIEATLAGHAGVKFCAVLAREDSPGNKQLVGYVVPRQGGSPTQEDLKGYLKTRLPDYMTPAQFVLLDSLPLTQNGKVDRKALPAPSDAMALAGRIGDSPRNQTEKSIATVFSELLGVRDVGVHDDFFDLGGHSLLALQAMSRIRDAFHVDLPAQTLFESPTVAEVAAIVAEACGGGEEVQRIERRAQPGPYPLSFAQEQFWFLDQLVPGSPAYNIVDAVPVRGDYDPNAMKRALQELVRRHGTLRTAFSHLEGRLSQTIAPSVDFPLPQFDLGSLPEKERELEWVRIVREVGRRPFDLSQAPLLRAVVVHRSQHDHLLLLAIHHIIADERAMEVIQEEVTQLYRAFSRGQPSPLPELAIQYADYACWQRDRLQGEVLHERAQYWRRELEGASPVLALPTDRPRPLAQTFLGATELFAVPKELSDRLQSLGREEQATLFMVLLTGFAALLHRYSGQTDILVGTPVSGRTQTETERLIGCFLNTVVLRSQLAEGQTFRSLLQQVRGRSLGAFAHSDLPFEHLVSTLAPDRDPSRTPLFQVMFILHNRDGVSRVSKVSDHRELETGTSKFDLTLYVSETDHGLDGLMEYSTDLFEAETVRDLCRHFGLLLEAIAADPDQRVSRLPMLAEADRQKLLVTWNDTATTFPGNQEFLHRLFEHQAALTPDRVAVVFERQSLTYGELDRRANQLAHHLLRLGVGPDVLVGLLVERSLEMVVALLGILKAGGAYLPLDPSFPPDRLANMVDDSKIGVLITHRELELGLRARPASIVQLDSMRDQIATHGTDTPGSEGLRPDHLAYVLYTSGSTGKPKGVAIPHSAIVNFLLSMQREPGFTSTDTLLAVTTLSFDIAGLELFLPLLCGGKVEIASRDDAVDPRRLMERMRVSGCTMMQATPATWRMLVEAGWKGSTSLRVLCGGEALQPDLAQALLPRCAELWNMYGPTETTVWSTVHRMVSAAGQAPIGRPIANTQVFVLDPHLQLLPPGVVGELYIGGDGLARGYLYRPELTRERFLANPFAPGALMYRTGDLARWRPDGTLECLGRTDHQVKLRGFRVELGEVEAALRAVPGVREVVVVAERLGSGDPRLVAYWVGEAERQALYEGARGALPPYMVPSAFARLEAFPLTSSGKVDRKALPEPEEGSWAGAATLRPRNDAELRVAQVWSDVLGLPSVGVNQDFFELGGTSLLAVRARARLEQEFGVAVPLRLFFESPTVESVARKVNDSSDPNRPIVAWLSRVPPDKSPLFCLFGIHLYQDLAAALDRVRPVVAMHVPVRYRPGDEGALSIESIAARYVEQVQSVQPHGPYHLAGFCFGGVTAYEVARQLETAGEHVAEVVILDGFLPGARVVRPLELLRDLAARIVDPEAWRSWLVRKTTVVPEITPGSDGLVDFDVTAPELVQVGTSYESRLRPVRARVVVVRATGRRFPMGVRVPPDLGWSRLGGEVRALDVTSDHMGLLRRPHVDEISRFLAMDTGRGSETAS